MTSQSAPDLSKLADTYDILTELSTDGDGRSVTYLGRHRELGRDVAITVVSVPGGRVRLAVGWSELPVDSLPDACTDARTIGELAHTMLTGEVGRGESDKSLAELRPDLPPAIVEQTEALLRCRAGGMPRDIAEYL